MSYYVPFIMLGGVIVAILIAIRITWGGYQDLVTLQQTVREAWAQVQNAYQRRFDLVPNLVAAVDSFMARQQTTMQNVIAMRQRVVTISEQAVTGLKDASTPSSLEQLGATLTKSVGSFVNAVSEAYPDIKGDSLFVDLNGQLKNTEDEVFIQRGMYNASVKTYNRRRLATLGGLIGGGLFNLTREEKFFKGDEAAQKAPSVKEALKG